MSDDPSVSDVFTMTSYTSSTENKTENFAEFCNALILYRCLREQPARQPLTLGGRGNANVLVVIRSQQLLPK
jgi:hypothetical protein